MTRGTLIRIAASAGLSALLGGTIAGCGTAPEPDMGSAKQAEARVRAILGGMRDLPDGFSDRPRDAWRAPFRAKDPRCRLLLNAAGARPPRDGLTATAGATFPGAGLGETAGLRLTEYAGDLAARHLSAIAAAMGDCSSARSADAGGEDRLRASPLPIEADGRVEATRMRGRVGGFPYEMHLVFARSGRTLISLVHTGISAPRAERTAEIARLLLARVESGAGDRAQGSIGLTGD